MITCIPGGGIRATVPTANGKLSCIFCEFHPTTIKFKSKSSVVGKDKVEGEACR